jgi:hypothetical protein
VPALYVLLWFMVADPAVYEVKYFSQPVPAVACGMVGQQLQQIWHADGVTCAEKPPQGAKALPGTVSPDRYA